MQIRIPIWLETEILQLVVSRRNHSKWLIQQWSFTKSWCLQIHINKKMSITIGIRLINLLVNPTARGKVAAQEGVEVQLMKEARQILLQKREAQRNIVVLVVLRRVQKDYLNNINLFLCKLRITGRHRIRLCLSLVLRLQLHW